MGPTSVVSYLPKEGWTWRKGGHEGTPVPSVLLAPSSWRRGKENHRWQVGGLGQTGGPGDPPSTGLRVVITSGTSQDGLRGEVSQGRHRWSWVKESEVVSVKRTQRTGVVVGRPPHRCYVSSSRWKSQWHTQLPFKQFEQEYREGRSGRG